MLVRGVGRQKPHGSRHGRRVSQGNSHTDRHGTVGLRFRSPAAVQRAQSHLFPAGEVRQRFVASPSPGETIRSSKAQSLCGQSRGNVGRSIDSGEESSSKWCHCRIGPARQRFVYRSRGAAAVPGRPRPTATSPSQLIRSSVAIQLRWRVLVSHAGRPISSGHPSPASPSRGAGEGQGPASQFAVGSPDAVAHGFDAPG